MAIFLHCLFAIFLMVSISVIQGNAPGRLFYILSAMTKDEGIATYCGPPGYNFSLTWKPKVINIHEKTTFHLDMVAPVEFDHGVVHIALYLPNSTAPLVEFSNEMSCQKMKLAIPTMSCPVKKNDHLFGTYEASPGSDFPPLNVKLNLSVIVRNKNQEEFACLYAVIKFIY